jgi:Fe-S-cluster containining protein
MSEPTDAELWPTLFAAAQRGDIDAAITNLYDRLDGEVRRHGAQCFLSGRCCNFDQYGHRMYVTALETAWVLTHNMLPGALPGAGAIDLQGPCAYQIDGMCSIHATRPLGCRIFFCQEGTDDWQHELYERFLGALRDLHTAHSLPYRYIEWRAAMADAAAYQSNKSSSSTG